MISCQDCANRDITILQLRAKVASLEEDCRLYTTTINDVCLSNQKLREQVASLGGEAHG